VSVIFLSCIDLKQQQSDRKLCAKDLGEKRSHLGLVSFLIGFYAEGTVHYLQALFNHINGKQH